MRGRLSFHYTYWAETPVCFSRSAWAENIANAWLPYTNIWENFKELAVTLILRCESKFRFQEISRRSILRAHMNSLS